MEKERKNTLKDMFADRKCIVAGQENPNVCIDFSDLCRCIDEIFEKASENERMKKDGRLLAEVLAGKKKEMFDMCLAFVKNYVKGRGLKRVKNDSTLSVDVSKWDILCHFGYQEDGWCTLDYVEYVPDKDELRYLIIDEGTGNPFKDEKFEVGDYALLEQVFDMIVRLNND